MNETNVRSDSVLLKACHKRHVPYTPVWLMRQAGRYLKSYQQFRAKAGFLDLCKDPEAACKITLLPVQEIGVDAAIIFADILLIAEPMGFLLSFVDKQGPVIANPIQSPKDFRDLPDAVPLESLDYVMQAIRNVRESLPIDIPLIGFAGAPFTLASYLIEGGRTSTFSQTKKFMYSNETLWNQLLAIITKATSDYLVAQIQAGADLIQIFDSWVGCLNRDQYQQFVFPHMRYLFELLDQQLHNSVPMIHFAAQSAHLQDQIKKAGGTVIGLDHRISLDHAWQILGPTPIQGNLDPAILLCPPPIIKKEAKRILTLANNQTGHIFNLGHGVLPQTPVDNVKYLVDFVHEHSSR